MASEVLGNTGSGNGLLPDGTKPLLEPMLTIINEVLWHSPEDNFTRNAQDVYAGYEFEND